MSSTSEKIYAKVGVLLYSGADLLDFAGPMEVLAHVLHNHNPDDPDPMFTIETMARTPTIRSICSLTVKVDKLLEDAVKDLADYDILVVPGGPPSVVQPLLEGGSPEVDVIRRFAALPLSSSQNPRILFSVCTGAFLLGGAGILSGMTVTTHHRGVDVLREICGRFNDKNEPSTTVMHKRYIDGGYLPGDAVTLLTAGGVSSGLDATFHVVREMAGADMAAFVSRVMEYDWTELKK
ncbi:ThiJ/PfpI family protein [Penicillium verhagenii]|uniref:ThiJ/PfpI family protein n=1 Tax=Penicillium verhagenii TaxID=1562060 RepID=UPI00254586C7|nr:ThiJ/PfpI family protein [Penicillium verhagenii]KAJ5947950.1 ThiJ/PfpI family protein [Penicillium verhagenii]